MSLDIVVIRIIEGNIDQNTATVNKYGDSQQYDDILKTKRKRDYIITDGSV